MVTVNLIGVSNIAPLHPQLGDIWLDTISAQHRIFNGKVWVHPVQFKTRAAIMASLKQERAADEQDARLANKLWAFKHGMLLAIIFSLLLTVTMCNKEYQRTHPWGVTEQEQ